MKHLAFKSIVLSFIAATAFANSLISLRRGDFDSAATVFRDGNILVSANLSNQGKAKLGKLGEKDVEKKVHISIGGVTSNLVIREVIQGNKIEMGPYRESEAKKIVSEINN
jgi:hypothetical protein